MKRIAVTNFGPVREADVALGDLTVVVGPQATGKSVFLQLLRLVIDAPAIRDELRRFNIDWKGKPQAFREVYFGEGMGGLVGGATALAVDGKAQDIDTFATGRHRKAVEPKMFYIPAQRVVSIRDGLTQPFTAYRPGDPYALREFSENLHQLVQTEFTDEGALFPRKNRLSQSLRDPIERHIFGGYSLEIESDRSQKRVVLKPADHGPALPYLVWSAGQREFVPLLLGLYWLCPPSKVTRRRSLQWAVIEEPEMGLHPQAIVTVLALVMELLSRDYRVCLSTHSPAVLDMVWALRFLQSGRGEWADVLKLFGLPRNPAMKELAASVLHKRLAVHYFARDGVVRDISGLDPGAVDSFEAEWGGLTEFSSRAADVVADVARRAEPVPGA
jgi:hypothetical protein